MRHRGRPFSLAIANPKWAADGARTRPFRTGLSNAKDRSGTDFCARSAREERRQARGKIRGPRWFRKSTAPPIGSRLEQGRRVSPARWRQGGGGVQTMPGERFRPRKTHDVAAEDRPLRCASTAPSKSAMAEGGCGWCRPPAVRAVSAVRPGCPRLPRTATPEEKTRASRGSRAVPSRKACTDALSVQSGGLPGCLGVSTLRRGERANAYGGIRVRTSAWRASWLVRRRVPDNRGRTFTASPLEDRPKAGNRMFRSTPNGKSDAQNMGGGSLRRPPCPPLRAAHAHAAALCSAMRQVPLP